MLCLSRKRGERIFIGEDIVIRVLNIDSNKVRLGIEAPDHVEILREELVLEKPPGPAPSPPEKE